MITSIFYPANKQENYAKGTADGGVYFEVPAVFKDDDTCDIPATDVKVNQFLLSLSMKPYG